MCIPGRCMLATFISYRVTGSTVYHLLYEILTRDVPLFERRNICINFNSMGIASLEKRNYKVRKTLAIQKMFYTLVKRMWEMSRKERAYSKRGEMIEEKRENRRAEAPKAEWRWTRAGGAGAFNSEAHDADNTELTVSPGIKYSGTSRYYSRGSLGIRDTAVYAVSASPSGCSVEPAQHLQSMPRENLRANFILGWHLSACHCRYEKCIRRISFARKNRWFSIPSLRVDASM